MANFGSCIWTWPLIRPRRSQAESLCSCLRWDSNLGTKLILFCQHLYSGNWHDHLNVSKFSYSLKKSLPCQDGRRDKFFFSPRGACSRQVLGHLLPLRFFQDLPREVVAGLGGSVVAHQVGEKALPDALKNNKFKRVLNKNTLTYFLKLSVPTWESNPFCKIKFMSLEQKHANILLEINWQFSVPL